MPRPARPDTREALLRAASDEFARAGVDGARVEDIARRAGISKGAFYLHFATKEEALREIVQRLLGALDDHALRRKEIEARSARDAAGEAPGSPRRTDAECAADLDLLELLWRNRRTLAALEGARRGAGAELVREVRRRVRAIVSGRVRLRAASGELRPDVDADVLADALAGAHDALARRMIGAKARPDLARWARTLHAAIEEGVGIRPQAHPEADAERAPGSHPRRGAARPD